MKLESRPLSNLRDTLLPNLLSVWFSLDHTRTNNYE